MKPRQDIEGRAMLDTTRLDIENTSMVGTVEFVVEDGGVFERVVDIGVIEGLLVSTATHESIQFALVSGDDDSSLYLVMIFDEYYFLLALPQLFRLANIHYFQLPQVVLQVLVKYLLFSPRIQLSLGSLLWYFVEFDGVFEESVGENGGGGEERFGPGEVLPERLEQATEH